MKYLKFKTDFIQEILNGDKTATWRLFDDKDLKIGDELELIDKSTNKFFARAKIRDIQEKSIGELSDNELKNHGYQNIEQMIKSHKVYYGDRVSPLTKVKMITFFVL